MTTDESHRLRASDAEREEVTTIVRAAMTEGRLTLQEGEDRLAAVYASRYRDELAQFTADLPDGGRRARADTPEARAAARAGLRRHTRFVVVVGVLLTALWLVSGAHFFWPAIPLAFLVMGLMRHARWVGDPHGGPWRHHRYAGPRRTRW